MSLNSNLIIRSVTTDTLTTFPLNDLLVVLKINTGVSILVALFLARCVPYM